ncbi:6-carboxy-5,6,7,8-tetrahydropterin synthase [Thermaurantimonas aggregans]|uniref:6-carboxy-5,6,7,8-tetrahydropterin synthase n=1 Tax=Thermaurantimonas aggregans TaxID=2173829 RepID=A0A401XNL2_9FLAO|nr:6-carboxytetrahydropterin synthase [Thermaurantimonas aggregans]MCX8147644.1 6-carboxytetrahydropterin synthase [Thermaurantimonas aggregans]GCD78553.1 6-carboxy-5,6,7,8-tetrahydropterin synthase [Thermaurantimonas aggregans]
MKLVTVSRHAHFNAAHRLHNPSWNAEQNEKVFGLCNNEYFHGHNYELIVSVTGPVDPDTGYVMDMKELSDLIKKHVEARLDHKNLNLQVEEFKHLIPSAENIAIVIYDWLRPHISPSLKLKITLYETPRNYVEYSGEEA